MIRREDWGRARLLGRGTPAARALASSLEAGDVNGRRLGTAVGAGGTAALVVAGVLTALLDSALAFSAIVGLPVGLLAGLAVVGWTLVGPERLDTPPGRVLGGTAAFGYAVLGYAVLSYANVAGIRGALSLPQVAIASLAVAVATAGALCLFDSDGAATT